MVSFLVIGKENIRFCECCCSEPCEEDRLWLHDLAWILWWVKILWSLKIPIASACLFIVQIHTWTNFFIRYWGSLTTDKCGFSSHITWHWLAGSWSNILRQLEKLNWLTSSEMRRDKWCTYQLEDFFQTLAAVNTVCNHNQCVIHNH